MTSRSQLDDDKVAISRIFARCVQFKLPFSNLDKWWITFLKCPPFSICSIDETISPSPYRLIILTIQVSLLIILGPDINNVLPHLVSGNYLCTASLHLISPGPVWKIGCGGAVAVRQHHNLYCVYNERMHSLEVINLTVNWRQLSRGCRLIYCNLNVQHQCNTSATLFYFKR